MQSIVVSNSNQHIKKIKELKQKKYRDFHSQFVIEGIKMVTEAMTYGMNMTTMVLREDYETNETLREVYRIAQEMGIFLLVVEFNLFGQLCDTETPQGVLAILEKKGQDLGYFLQGENHKILLLDTIQDPGNLGTIIRTADAFGISGVVLSNGCVDLYNPKVLRATMGSVFHLPIIANVNLLEWLPKLKDKGFVTIATDPYGEGDIANIKRTPKMAIVIGNEAKGISQAIEEVVDIRMKISMSGNAESLNASIAAGIFIYEICVKKT